MMLLLGLLFILLSYYYEPETFIHNLGSIPTTTTTTNDDNHNTTTTTHNNDNDNNNETFIHDLGSIPTRVGAGICKYLVDLCVIARWLYYLMSYKSCIILSIVSAL